MCSLFVSLDNLLHKTVAHNIFLSKIALCNPIYIFKHVQCIHKPMPTDVLSFPLGVDGKYDVDENNGCKMLGDIVISMERAQEQANLYGHPLQREVAFLTVHSMLHLLGYDHENGGLEAMRMREKEEAVLLQLGLPRTVSYTE